MRQSDRPTDYPALPSLGVRPFERGIGARPVVRDHDRWRAAGLCLLALACTNGGGQERPAGAPPEGTAKRVVPVTVGQAELGVAARTVTATGAVEPIRTVNVNSQLSGALRSVEAEEGDQVREGTVLARIDDREIETQLKSAEAALAAAERAAERAERLFEQQIITAAEYERDQTALAAARAVRDQLRTRLGYAVVRAPLTGVVLEQRVEAGDIVAPQTRLFAIADVSTLVVQLPISELDVTAIDAGDPVVVALDALPGRTFEGTVRRVFPAADTVTRLVPVEVALTGPAAREALPGFLARVTFQLDPRAGVLLVPAAAVIEQGGESAVFVISDGKASRRPIERGGIYQGRIEVRSGLAPGDTVATVGTTMLRDGASVRVVDQPGAGAAGATGATP